MESNIRITIYCDEITITVYNSAQSAWIMECMDRVGLKFMVDIIDGAEKIVYTPETHSKAKMFDLMYEIADNVFGIELF